MERFNEFGMELAPLIVKNQVQSWYQVATDGDENDSQGFHGFQVRFLLPLPWYYANFPPISLIHSILM